MVLRNCVNEARKRSEVHAHGKPTGSEHEGTEGLVRKTMRDPKKEGIQPVSTFGETWDPGTHPAEVGVGGRALAHWVWGLEAVLTPGRTGEAVRFATCRGKVSGLMVEWKGISYPRKLGQATPLADHQ